MRLLVLRVQGIVGRVPGRGRIVIVVYSSSVGVRGWMSGKTSRRRDLEMDGSRGLARVHHRLGVGAGNREGCGPRDSPQADHYYGALDKTF